MICNKFVVKMVNFWLLFIGMVFKMIWCLGFDESVFGFMVDR